MSKRHIENLLWLCSIPSQTGHEGPICDALDDFVQGHARDMARFRIGNSLVLTLNQRGSGPKVCLVGHTDVVPTLHDREPYVDGDRIYGPGASDMKSGLALMLGLLEEPCPTDCPVTLVLYAGEEGPFAENELGRVVAELPWLKSTEIALALEPTDNQLQLGCGGSIQAQVTFAGRSAHSSRPWQGENAIYNSLEFLSKLSQHAPSPREVEGLTWITSMSATLIRGGRAPNVIPDETVINVNARYAPDQTSKEVEQTLRELIGPGASLELVDVSPPAPPHRNHPLIRALEACGVAAVHPKFAWTDVARFAQLGVPAANFGPGCLAQAHQRNEWTSISALHEGDAILRRWLMQIGAAKRNSGL